VSDRRQSLVMLERHIESYGKGIPYLVDTNVKGKLIVIEVFHLTLHLSHILVLSPVW
jgi:hypothetical protein